MPRKVLITKDTLEEILAKYQGGGSGGGSGKLYQLAFSYAFTNQGNIVKCIGDNSDKDFNIDVILFYTENDFKCFCEHCNNQTQYDDSVLSFPTNMNEFVTFLNNYINGNNDYAIKNGLLTDLCVFSTKIYRNILNPLGRLDIAEDALSKDVLFGISTSLTKVVNSYYFDKTKISIDDTSYTGSVDTPVLSVSDNTIYDVGNQEYDDIVLTNSCTLAEYGTSASGGTVEAEPIVSIKMTNMDCTGNDGGENRYIRDLQFYCTKERWDNFVSLAHSVMSVDVTYNNFDSVFKTLSASNQATVLGYLMMDYYNGKVLPEAYLQNNVTVDSIVAKDKYGIVSLETLTDPQTNIEVVWSANFKGSSTSSESGSIPAPDMVQTNYYTANTVITVEEIAGPAIGSSSGSGSDIDLSNLQVEHLTFSNDQPIGLKSRGSIWSVLTLSFQTQNDSYTFWAKYMCSEEEMYDLFNDKLEQYRQQGLVIPTVTDHDTLTQAFNTIVDTLFALDSSSAALTMTGFITLMFGPSVYGPFQGFMKDSGTTLFSLIRNGDDFGMCILNNQGQTVDVTQMLVNDIGTTKPTNISLWING